MTFIIGAGAASMTMLDSVLSPMLTPLLQLSALLPLTGAMPLLMGQRLLPCRTRLEVDDEREFAPVEMPHIHAFGLANSGPCPQGLVHVAK